MKIFSASYVSSVSGEEDLDCIFAYICRRICFYWRRSMVFDFQTNKD